jgi:hypothetical protein
MAATMKINLRLIYLKFNGNKLVKDIEDMLQRESRNAARAWLKAVLVKVPVWTGEARGSLRPLGAFLRVAVPISPSSSKWAQRAMLEGHTAEAGAAQGSFEFKTETKLRIVFEARTEVIHYLINEFHNVNPPIHLIEPAPWLSHVAGKKAYLEYLEENLKNKIPNLKSYFVREKVTVTNG